MVLSGLSGYISQSAAAGLLHVLYKTITTLKYTTVDDIPHLYCRIYTTFPSNLWWYTKKKLCMHSYDILFPLNDWSQQHAVASKVVYCIKQRPWPPSSTTKQHPSAQATDYGATVCRLICHIYSAKQSQLRQPPHTTIVLLYPRISPDAPAVLLLYVLLLLLHWHFGI